MTRSRLSIFLCAITLYILPASSAWAYSEHNFRLGLGVIRHSDTGNFYIDASAEYEYRFMPVLGVGGLFEYTFSTPGETLIGVPVFWHPLAGDWVVIAAPLADFIGGAAYTGVRLGTRVPIGTGPLTITPSFAVDFIAGRQDLIFGLGIGI